MGNRNQKDGRFKLIEQVVRHAIRSELMTAGGQVNIVGMILVFLVTSVLAGGAWITDMVRIFRPNAQPTTNVARLVVEFMILVLICVVMSEIMARVAGSNPPKSASVSLPPPKLPPPPSSHASSLPKGSGKKRLPPVVNSKKGSKSKTRRSR